MELVKNPDGTVSVTVVVDGDEWKAAKKAAYDQVKKNITVKGFRKGHVPDAMIKRMIPEASIYEDAAREVMQPAFGKVLDMEEVKDRDILEQPKVAFGNLNKDQAELVYTLSLEPDAVVSSYKELGIEKEPVEVSDEEVDQAIKNALSRNADWELIEDETPSKMGDQVKVSFFEAGQDESEPEEITCIIGSGRIFPEFENQLAGFKTGETKDIHITYPNAAGAAGNAGKDADFTVTVKEIYTKEVPELTDEAAAELGIAGVSNAEELKNKAREDLLAAKTRSADNKYANDLLNAVLKNTEVTVPSVMIDDEVKKLVENMAMQMQNAGYSLTDYIESTGQSQEAFMESLRAQADVNAKARLAEKAIAREAGIAVTDEEVNSVLNNYANMLQTTAEEAAKMISVRQIKDDMLQQKVIDYLKSVQ